MSVSQPQIFTLDHTQQPSAKRGTVSMLARTIWGVATVVGMLCLPAQVLAETQPKPPSKICIDDAAACAEEPSTTGIKWHPGHYMQFLRGETDQAIRFKRYDEIATNTQIQGVGVFFRWSQLEGARGDYSAGIALIRAEVAKLKSLAVPKRLAFRVLESITGQDKCPGPSTFPAYLAASNKLYETNARCGWKRWDPEAMGWFIDMMNAYGAAFDNDPYVEMVSPFQETALGWGSVSPLSDFSEADLDTQYRRLALALKNAWKTTNVWMPTNWGLNGTRMSNYVGYLVSIGAGAGNPDICPDCNQPIDTIVRGYTGKILNAMCVEVSELGYDAVGSDGGYTAQQIYDYSIKQGVNHLFWDRNTVIGTTAQRWDTAILPIINTLPLKQLTCPDSYDACVK